MMYFRVEIELRGYGIVQKCQGHRRRSLTLAPINSFEIISIIHSHLLRSSAASYLICLLADVITEATCPQGINCEKNTECSQLPLVRQPPETSAFNMITTNSVADEDTGFISKLASQLCYTEMTASSHQRPHDHGSFLSRQKKPGHMMTTSLVP